MDDPFRLRVLKALTVALEEISTDAGFRHDLAGAVFRGRTVLGEDDPTPAITILEAPLPIDPYDGASDNAGSAGRWPLLIQGFAKDDPMNPSDPAHFLMADIRRRLAEVKKAGGPSGRSLLGEQGRVMNLTISRGVVRPPDELSASAYCYIEVALDIAENLDNPYA